jgi:hypothetical protein
VRTRRGAVALAIAAAAAVIAAVGTTALRGEPETPSPGPASAKPVAQVPRVLFAHSVVLDYVPGGGAVTTSAYDSFEVLAPDGTRQSRAIAGVAVGTPVFDGRDRVAYWRRAEMTRLPLEFRGPHDVVVWDVRSDQERVLLTLSDATAGGDLRWSVDGKLLIVPTRTGRTGGGASRLIAIDAVSGATRVLHESSGGSAGIGALYVDAHVLVGVRGALYVVLDLATGAVRTETRARVPSTFLVESAQFAGGPDGMVVELHRRFESEAGPLWIWNVGDPSTDVAKVDQRGISDPIFWPGRTEVVYTSHETQARLAAVDYRSGRTRPLLSPPGVTFVLAVDSGGRYALVRGDAGLQIVERIDDELRPRPDLPLVGGLTLTPLGVVFP